MDWSQKIELKYRYGFNRQELKLYSGLNDGSLYRIEKKYISQAKYLSLRKFLDPGPWRSVLHNKWITANYFDFRLMMQPEVYGLLDPRFGRRSDGKPLRGADELESLVKEKELTSFVFKHIGGGKGSFVYIIDDIQRSGDELIYTTIDNTKLGREEISQIIGKISGGLRGFIVQEKLQPHQIFSELTGGGLSSVRINTLVKRNGEIKAQFAFVRLGSKGKATDHIANGGIYAPVDLGRGTIQKGLCSLESTTWTSCHPFTGRRFVDVKVPYWEELMLGICLTAKSCSGLNFVGWDAVITPEGPYLIEGNVGTDVMLLQKLFGGFIENGIFDDWINELDLLEEERNCYNRLSNWKKQSFGRILHRT